MCMWSNHQKQAKNYFITFNRESLAHSVAVSAASSTCIVSSNILNISIEFKRC